MSTPLEKAERIAIAALNESHQQHGFRDVVKCKFCTSRSAEMTIAKHFAPAFSTIEALQAQIDALQQKVHLCAGYDRMEKALRTIKSLPVRDGYDTLLGYAGAVRAFCDDGLPE